MEIEFEITYTSANVIELLESELIRINDIKFDKTEQNGFDGSEMLFYFITSGSASAIAIAVIKGIVQIVVKLIQRDDVKSFKINNIECKGYNRKEIEELLEKVKTLQSQEIKRK